MDFSMRLQEDHFEFYDLFFHFVFRMTRFQTNIKSEKTKFRKIKMSVTVISTLKNQLDILDQMPDEYSMFEFTLETDDECVKAHTHIVLPLCSSLRKFYNALCKGVIFTRDLDEDIRRFSSQIDLDNTNRETVKISIDNTAIEDLILFIYGQNLTVSPFYLMKLINLSDFLGFEGIDQFRDALLKYIPTIPYKDDDNQMDILKQIIDTSIPGIDLKTKIAACKISQLRRLSKLTDDVNQLRTINEVLVEKYATDSQWSAKKISELEKTIRRLEFQKSLSRPKDFPSYVISSLVDDLESDSKPSSSSESTSTATTTGAEEKAESKEDNSSSRQNESESSESESSNSSSGLSNLLARIIAS